MKSYLLFIYALAGTLIFAASATVSLWYQQQQVRTKTETDSNHATARTGKESEHKSTADSSKTESDDDLRPVVRPSGLSNREETTHLVNNLRDRMKAVREREEQLNSRQKQLELIYQDIRGERNVLDEMRKQVSDEMKALSDKMTSVDRRIGDLEQQRQTVTKNLADTQKRQMDIDGNERKNLDRMATMYDSMQPESAARILQQLADSGRLDTGVKLLAQMKERQAAKVLAELPDAALAAQLLEKMRNLKRPSPNVATSATNPAILPLPTPVSEIPRQ